MKQFLSIIFLLLLFSLANSCREDILLTKELSNSDKPGVILDTIRTIQIKVHHYFFLSSEDLTIGFDSVKDDSRCPKGMVCIWAGNGKIKIWIEKGNSERVYTELNTSIEPKIFYYNGYAVELKSLIPYPVYGKKTKYDAYFANLIVMGIRK